MHAGGWCRGRTEAGLDVYRQLFRELREAGHDRAWTSSTRAALVRPSRRSTASRGVRPALPGRPVRAAGVARPGLALAPPSWRSSIREGVHVDASRASGGTWWSAASASTGS
jgi:hypothetical protein